MHVRTDDPSMTADESLRGRLLVATPSLLDPNFERAVILMLEHTEDGALGVVINRPTELTVATAVGAWADAASDPSVVFEGGPVSPSTVIGLGRLRPGATNPSFDAIFGRVGVVDLDDESTADSFEGVRLFAGYAGWGPVQLEDELEAGSWFVVAPHPDDVLSADPASLWRGVVVRQGGLYATFPEDPALN